MTCTGGIGHTLSSCLLGCGIGVWLGSFGVASPISCTSQSVFRCILHSFASGGKSVTPPTDHGSMSSLMSGLTKATGPPHKMRQRKRQKCVCCVAISAPPLQFVMSVRSTIVLNVLTPTLMGPMLFVKYNTKRRAPPTRVPRGVKRRQSVTERPGSPRRKRPQLQQGDARSHTALEAPDRHGSPAGAPLPMSTVSSI